MMGKDIKGFAFNDEKTKDALKHVYENFRYIMDPHGAVGYLALKEYQKEHPETMGVILETAHPSKFIDDVEEILGSKIEIPERLARLEKQTKSSLKMSTNYLEFKEWINNHRF